MKHPTKPSILALVLACGTAFTPAFASTYTDRASFEAAIQNLATLDFEALIGTAEYPQNYPWGSGHMAQPPSWSGEIVHESHYQPV